MSSLEPHVQGMYDYFDQKLGFNRPPTMHFDSEPGNQANVLGKTAYYDPSNLQIHVFTDGRHPKDMLRSIAHELIHHQQNLEGRLNVGGYMGEGYYLKNEAMRELEQEAMLQGNALMREYEDTIKSEEKNKMSLKEWKNNELNGLLLKKFGILKEYKNPDPVQGRIGDESDEEFYMRTQNPSSKKNKDEEGNEVKEVKGKPDYIDLDKDGDKEESMKDAAEDAKEKKEEMNEEADCPKCKGKCKCEEMNEEVVEEISGREAEDETFNDPEGAADRYRNRPKKDKLEGLQETLKRIAKAKSITLKSSGKKIK
tara:strand:+ start:118 stop:1050 length:933 start_codon:yes stop_codon:yes gene_type:complete